MKNKEVVKIQVRAGENFDDVAAKAKQAILDINHDSPELKSVSNYVAQYKFNGINCEVMVNTDIKNLYRDYVNASYMGWETIGPDCFPYSTALQKQIDDKKAEAHKEAELAADKYRLEAETAEKATKEKIKDIKLEILDEAKFDEEAEQNGISLTTINEEKLGQQVEKNIDAYGARIFSYAYEWGCLMQKEMTDRKITEVTPEALSEFAQETSSEADYDGITGYMYGAAVGVLARHWKHGEALRKWHNKEYGHEGEGVINPAIMNIGVTEEEK